MDSSPEETTNASGKSLEISHAPKKFNLSGDIEIDDQIRRFREDDTNNEEIIVKGVIEKIMGITLKDDLLTELSDGIILCKLFKRLVPDRDIRNPAESKNLSFIQKKDNISIFTNACRSISIPDVLLITHSYFDNHNKDLLVSGLITFIIWVLNLGIPESESRVTMNTIMEDANQQDLSACISTLTDKLFIRASLSGASRPIEISDSFQVQNSEVFMSSQQEQQEADDEDDMMEEETIERNSGITYELDISRTVDESKSSSDQSDHYVPIDHNVSIEETGPNESTFDHDVPMDPNEVMNKSAPIVPMASLNSNAPVDYTTSNASIDDTTNVPINDTTNVPNNANPDSRQPTMEGNSGDISPVSPSSPAPANFSRQLRKSWMEQHGVPAIAPDIDPISRQNSIRQRAADFLVKHGSRSDAHKPLFQVSRHTAYAVPADQGQVPMFSAEEEGTVPAGKQAVRRSRHPPSAPGSAQKHSNPPKKIRAIHSAEAPVPAKSSSRQPEDLQYVEQLGKPRMVAGAIYQPRYIVGVDKEGNVVSRIQKTSIPRMRLKSHSTGIPPVSAGEVQEEVVVQPELVEEQPGFIMHEQPVFMELENVTRRNLFTVSDDDEYIQDEEIVANTLHDENGTLTSEQLERNLDQSLRESLDRF